MPEPVPTTVFDSYWRFAAERQEIFFRRLAGEPPPWTDDPILRCHRFTNAYRASDRVSQYLIREVQYRADRPQSARELFFRTLLFKIFNRIETWEEIERHTGPISLESTDAETIAGILESMMANGRPVYSAAYIVPSPPFGRPRKHQNHLALLWRMIEDGLPDGVACAPSLRAVFELLLGCPGLGKFLAFQYAIDLNYSTLLPFEESDFVVAGPGALDGIAKCFESTGGMTPEEIILWTADRQESEFAARDIRFRDLWGRHLQPVDCQNLYCEISKYARVAHPDVRGLSGRTRIKQTFQQSCRSLPPPTYPPKWRIRSGKVRGQEPTSSRSFSPS